MQKKMCEVCRHPYESEDHLCREAMLASDGGPAFPSYASDHRGAACNTTFEPRGGVTMRDYFAARATEEDIEEHREYGVNPKTGSREYVMTREQAKYAYADAMLRARVTAPAADPVRDAAPELLEALQEADAVLRNVDAHMDERIAAAERVSTAIAKAGGAA